MIKQLISNVLEYANSWCYSWLTFFMWIATRLLYNKINTTYEEEERYVTWLKKNKVPRDIKMPYVVIWIKCQWSRLLNLFELVIRKIKIFYDKVPIERIKKYILDLKLTKTPRTTDSIFIGSLQSLNCSYIAIEDNKLDKALTSRHNKMLNGSLQNPGSLDTVVEENEPDKDLETRDNKTLKQKPFNWHQPYFDWAESLCGEETLQDLDDKTFISNVQSPSCSFIAIEENNKLDIALTSRPNKMFNGSLQNAGSLDVIVEENKPDKYLQSRDNKTLQQKPFNWHQPYFEWAVICASDE